MTGGPSGDASLASLLEHRAWVRALARRLVSDPNAADDIEQETWRMALERPPRHGGSLRAWLSSVVRNAARMAGRSRTRRTRHEGLAAPRTGSGAPDDVVAEAEIQHRLVGHVLALEEPYRRTVLARYFEGLEAAAIAQREGVPVETVRTRLKRAVAQLREELGADLGDDREAWALLLAVPCATTQLPLPPTATAVWVSLGKLRSCARHLGGGAAMGVGTKFAVGALACAWIAAGWWLLRDEPAAPAQSPIAEAPDAQGPRPHGANRATSPAAVVATAPVPGEPALFARVDRDLDLHGIVVRADGTPVAGAKVESLDYAWRRTAMRNFGALFTSVPGPSTTTDAEGAFAIRLRRGEAHHLRATADGFAPRESGPFQAGERVRLTLTAPVTLRVNLKDAAGAPVPSAELWLFGPAKDDAPWINARATTDAAGVCTFGGLPGGAKARLMRVAGVSDFDPVRVELPASGEKTLDVVAPAGRTVRGRVTDASTGAGIAGAIVADRYTGLGATTTDGGGAFELRGFTGKSTDTLHCTATGYARAAARVAGDGEVAFALRRAFAVTGRATDADGKPVAGALVAVEAPDGRDTPPSTGYATSDGEGRFRVEGLDRMLPHALTVSATGFGHARSLVRPPAEGTDAFDAGDILLAPGRLLGGVVRRPDGTPWTGVSVTVTPAGAGGVADRELRAERRTDDLGRFRFADVTPGAYVVEARMDDGSSPSVTVKVPVDLDVLDLVLPPEPSAAGTITVTVTDDAGTPLPGMNVIPTVPGRSRPGRTDFRGRATLANSPDAPVSIIDVGPQVPEQPYLRAPRVRVVPGKSEYAVVLERGAWVTCQVLDPEGKPFPKVTVNVDPGDRCWNFAFTDDEGRTRIALPKTGAYTLTFGQTVKGLDPSISARLEGVTAQSGEVVLRCSRVAMDRTATIRVVDADGESVEGVDVIVWPAQTNGKGTTTDGDGRARYTGLPASECKVYLSNPRPQDLRPEPVTFTPDGGEVVFRLPRVAFVTGTVTWSTGEPAAGALVTVLIETGGDPLFGSTTNADAQGRFSLPIYAEGDRRFRLDVWSVPAGGKRASSSRAVTAADRDLSVVLTR